MSPQLDPTRTIRVLIVDDEPDLRVLLRTMLSLDSRFEIAGEARDGGEGLAMFRELRPDVLVIDQRMPVLEGLEVAKEVLAEAPDQPVILMSAFLDDAIRAEAAALGIQRVLGKQLLKDIGEEILLLVG
jgi:two-component system chemotaxis response regulator CheY